MTIDVSELLTNGFTHPSEGADTRVVHHLFSASSLLQSHAVMGVRLNTTSVFRPLRIHSLLATQFILQSSAFPTLLIILIMIKGTQPPSSAHDSLSIDIDVVDTSRAESSYTGAVETPDLQKPTFTTDFAALVDSQPTSRFVVQSTHVRECLAEFLGTFVMICFGFGVNNQVSLSKDKNGTWLSINMCWGIAVMLGVHCADGISGAHLNPAVSIAMATYNRLAWRKVPGYIIAQLLGAFVGAAAIYALNYELLNVVDPERTFTRANFSTYPSATIGNITAFYTEFLATALLVLGVFAITDKRNRPASPFGVPLHFMVLIWAIGMAFGMNTGYAINPARDFAPRLFTSIAGWGSQVFTLRNHYFWIPIVAPICGGVVGGGTYRIFVEMHHPPARL